MQEGYFYGFVCLMDALGTKGAWGHSDPADFVAKLSALKANVEAIAKKREKPYANGIFDFRFFQDTVFITLRFPTSAERGPSPVPPDEVVLFPKFSGFVAGPFAMALFDEVYFRGAVSQGWFYWSEEMLLGPAIDDAASYFEAADWLGVVCTPAAGYAAHYCISEPSLACHGLPHAFLEYDVPMLDSASRRLFAIDWPFFFRQSVEAAGRHEGSARDFLLQLFSRSPIPERATAKFSNAVAFYDFSQERSAA